MADVISRLKLDSGEFDSKIKRAGQELMAYSEHCKKMGLEMGYANKDAKEFAKALGSMQTTSSSARGKINELTEAFVNLKVMYKNMTDEEKNNAFGKNLAASLDQLKTRIDQAKAELNDVSKELGNTKQAEVDTTGGLEGLTSALGINIKTLAGWGTAIAAGKVALDVAKDAFFASESSVDEWGRTVAASQSLYEGFLTAINNGDISGYLSNIDSIVKAARLAYDELDKLGTMKTIQAPQISAQQTENERIRSMIQTGRYIAPQDGRRNAVFNGREMQTGDKLTAGQIRALEKQLQGGMQKMVKLVGNEVDQTGKAINAYYDKLAKTNGMSLQEFKKGTSSWEEFSKRMQGYEQYKEWDKQARTEFAKQGGRGYVNFDKSNPYAEFRKWGTFRVDKEGDNSYKNLVALIQQRDQQVGQVYSTQAQAYRTMNRAEGFTVSKLMGNGGKGNKNKKEYDDLQKVQQEIAKLTKEAYTADSKRVEEIQAEIAGLQEEERRLTAIRDLVTNKNNDPLKALESQFPDMSKENFNTGYAGSAQAKYDSARADLALGPMNLDAVNDYIGSIKGMLKDADLGSELYNNMTEKLKDATTVSTLLQEMMERGLEGADLETTAQALKEKLLGDGIDQTAIQSFLDTLNKQIEEAGGVGLKLNSDTGEVTDKDKGNDPLKELKDKTGKLISGLSDVSSGMKNLGIEIPEEVDELIGIIGSVMQIVQGVGTIISVFQTSAITANTIALGALTSAIIANTVSNAIPFFSNGGVVHAADGFVSGNSYSADLVPAMVNSGELILNRAQQGVIASELEGGGMQNLHLDTIIGAEEIRLVLNNNGRRTGRGEYVTTRNSKIR